MQKSTDLKDLTGRRNKLPAVCIREIRAFDIASF